MARFPIVITLGAMLLGWIAGQMAFSDPALKPYLPASPVWSYGAAVAGALLVLLVGKGLQKRSSTNAVG